VDYHIVLALVSHLLEGKFVEAWIDVARGIYLAFAVRHDESYLCNAFFRAVLPAYVDVGEWDEPAAWYAGAAVTNVHGTAAVDFRVEVGCEAT